jgi:EAL domain-containing protein (putative c-di-GMP-specific phosphodiesterase class I)
LDQFPLDELKIDRAFLQAIQTGTDDAPIITAMIAMAHSLGLSTVVEGVENERQVTFLRHRGCDAYQGRRFSPAVPEAAFAALLTRS